MSFPFMFLLVTARAFGDPGTITSRSSPTPFTIGVFAFRGNRTHVPGDKYMSNPFPLPIEGFWFDLVKALMIWKEIVYIKCQLSRLSSCGY
jgi:hypothetical protein